MTSGFCFRARKVVRAVISVNVISNIGGVYSGIWPDQLTMLQLCKLQWAWTVAVGVPVTSPAL